MNSSFFFIARDRQLVDRCVAGDAAAWDTLYDEFHKCLASSIRVAIRAPDENLVEEIAARVWFALVANEGELLNRFDPARGCRLSTYLATIAKSRAMSLFRAERHRRSREKKASRSELVSGAPLHGWTGSELQEIVQRLTPREKSIFMSFYSPP